MPKFHDTGNLMTLLNQHGIPLTDARKRGEFYRTHFDWDTLSKRYNEGETIKELCSETGLSYDVVRANLKRRGCEMRGSHTRPTHTFIRDFKEIDEETAYLLGWIVSDGHVSNERLSIALQKRDKEHLEYLASLFTTKGIHERKHCYALDVHSIELVQTLRDMGISRRKSFEDWDIWEMGVPREYYPYFLLGIIEGDGHISSSAPQVQFLIPQLSVDGLLNYFDEEGIPLHYALTTLNDHGLTSVFFKKESFFRIMTHIYTKTPKVKPLGRKLESFKKRLDKSMGRTSPYKKFSAESRDSLARMKM